jgi:LPXTG-motif cell wall-anchored protein
MASYRRQLRALIAASLILGIAVAAPSSLTHAAPANTWTVAVRGSASGAPSTSCGAPSFVGATHDAIQDAIDAAPSGDIIEICTGTFAIGTSLIVAGKHLTITGQSPAETVLDGGGTARIMRIGDSSGPVSVNLSLLNFRNGFVSGDGVRGGAIFADHDATVTIDQLTFINNRSRDDHGGAIAMVYDTNRSAPSGSISVSNSSFHRNSAGVDGGGISIVGMTNSSTVTNSTFVENSAGRDGGAANSSFSDMEIRSSTLIDNLAAGGGAAVWSTNTSTSLIANRDTPNGGLCRDAENQNSKNAETNVSTDPLCLRSGSSNVNTNAVTYDDLDLAFLAPWGGDTPTVAIGNQSSALGAVPGASCQSVDQRGEPRPVSACAAGSFEHVSAHRTLTPSDVSTALVAGFPLVATPDLSATGLTPPIAFRLPVEVNVPTPSGVSFDTQTGSLSGEPTSTYGYESFIVSAVGNNGAIANGLITVRNCVLTEQAGVFLVDNVAELILAGSGACGMSSSYKLSADITLDDPWPGFGPRTEDFTGHFDGDHHRISGVRMVGGGVAFFTKTHSASISNLSLEVDISGDYGTAGLVKYATSTTVHDVQVTGTVTNPASSPDRGCIGGLVGEAENTTITQSSFVGDVSAPTGDWIGGLVGCAWANSSVSESLFDGNVVGRAAVGGLIGWIDSTNISDSYVIGDVQGSGHFVGAIVGEQQQANNPSVAPDPSTITRTYSNGQVSGGSDVGAVLGTGTNGALTANHWNMGSASLSTLDPIGLLNNGALAQPQLSGSSVVSLMSRRSFVDSGWTIEDGWTERSSSSSQWGICDTETLPFLLWQYTASTDPCAEPPTNTPSSGSSSSGQTGNDTPSSSVPTAAPATALGANVTDSTSLPTTESPNGSNIATKSAALRSRSTSTNDQTLPKTGSDVSIFATFGMCLGLFGSAMVVIQRRKKVPRLFL